MRLGILQQIVQNYANISRVLEELINSQQSYNDRTGLSYKEEEARPYTTKYNEPMRSDMNVDFIGQDLQEHPWKMIPRRISIQVPTYFSWLLLFMWKIWS